jgi:hypothetical protein
VTRLRVRAGLPLRPQDNTSPGQQRSSIRHRPLQAQNSPMVDTFLSGLVPPALRKALGYWRPQHDMPDLFGKTFIVTGGNSGVGFQVWLGGGQLGWGPASAAAQFA